MFAFPVALGRLQRLKSKLSMAKKSIEEKIEDIAKKQLGSFGVEYHIKTDNINREIEHALQSAKSKSGNDGGNFPDIKCLIKLPQSQKYVPIMIEVKGTKGDFAKIVNDEVCNYDDNGKVLYKHIKKYAMNGAVHYSEAIAKITKSYSDVIAIGFNGYEVVGNDEPITEMGVYYVSKANMYCPKKISEYSDFSFLKADNLHALEDKLKRIFLSENEKEQQTRELEDRIENTLTELNQDMRDKMRVSEPKDRLKLVCALIMAALGVDGKIPPLEIEELKGFQTEEDHDGAIILRKIKVFLNEKHIPQEKLDNIYSLYKGILNDKLYYRTINGESTIKTAFIYVKEEIMPIFTMGEEVHIDFTGKLLNVLTSWITERASDDEKNDVVLTPRYITELMAKLCKVNKDSFVWDWATGSAGFLVSAMKLMIDDANKTIKSESERKVKIANIKMNQLLGIELRQDIYVLAVLNMILMKDGASHILNKDSLTEYNGKYEQGENSDDKFPADVFLLNPPYSAEGKGFVFVEKALCKMEKGRAAVIIQENAGSGKGDEFTKTILQRNSLLASIRMPKDLFIGKSSVQTAIYLFEVGTPHDEKNLVTFIDFSKDGYARQNRKKSNSKVNLKDVDHVHERYAELVDIVLNHKTQTNFYTEANGLVVKDSISLNGNDWTFNQHRKIDTIPTEVDFRKTVVDYLSWKISADIKNEMGLSPVLNMGLLSDFTSEEIEALEKFRKNKVKFRKWKIGDLFDIHPTKSYKMTNKDLFRKKGKIPVVTNSSVGNGVTGYVDLEPTEKAGIVTYSDTTTDKGIFYQPYDFVGYSHVQGIYPFEPINWNENELLFFVSLFKKSAHGLFDFASKFNRTIAKEMNVSLPMTLSDEIDYSFMHHFISAQEKLVINGAVKYKD